MLAYRIPPLKDLHEVLEAKEMQNNIVEPQWRIKTMLIVEEECKKTMGKSGLRVTRISWSKPKRRKIGAHINPKGAENEVHNRLRITPKRWNSYPNSSAWA
uniref:Uncharacterized protein n=1 Tax=Solanum tuberosum TaxID=4113 RepID=M1DRT2_SOLTU